MREVTEDKIGINFVKDISG